MMYLLIFVYLIGMIWTSSHTYYYFQNKFGKICKGSDFSFATFFGIIWPISIIAIISEGDFKNVLKYGKHNYKESTNAKIDT